MQMGSTAHELISGIDLERARSAVTKGAVRTPTLISEDLGELAHGPVKLKGECLQRTGSFKLRGALAKVDALGTGAADGLIAASAGNHGRAVAKAARIRSLSCEVFMPREAPVSKVAAVRRLGARVNLEGVSVEEALALAGERAQQTGAALIHPFDDLDVIAGQATVGLELLEEVPDLARVVVPVGGGGLASGIGLAMRQAGVEVQVVGVQAQACAPYVNALAQEGPFEDLPVQAGATIADGIALKRPGRITLPLLRELLHELHTVSEDEIAAAMVFIAESAKLVSEGAGAVAVAALMRGRLPAVEGSTVAIVSGGNVDGGLFGAILRRRETEEGRRVRLLTRVADRPGGLAELLSLIAQARANLISLEHVREAIPLHVRETGVELMLETRGREHTRELVEALEGAGYQVSVE